MVERRLRITTGHVSLVATLRDTATAEAIWGALPIEGRVSRWGDEIYFRVPVDLEQEDDALEEVTVGDVGYWPPGNAVCVFWGPTPASRNREPRAASPVNVFAHVLNGATELASVSSGDTARLEAA